MPSTVIRRFTYSPNQRRLCVEFTTGKCYEYQAVEPEAVESLRSSRSKGVHFNAHIRGRYDYRQVAQCDADDQPVSAPVSGFP